MAVMGIDDILVHCPCLLSVINYQRDSVRYSMVLDLIFRKGAVLMIRNVVHTRIGIHTRVFPVYYTQACIQSTVVIFFFSHPDFLEVMYT